MTTERGDSLDEFLVWARKTLGEDVWAKACLAERIQRYYDHIEKQRGTHA